MISVEAAPRQARQSVLLVAAVFLLIAAWNVYANRPWVWIPACTASGVLLLTAALSARGSQLFHRYWMRLAAVLGAINARILLSLMYYFVFTPIGWIGRRLGRDPLQRRAKPQASYWIPRDQTRQSKEQFERTF